MCIRCYIIFVRSSHLVTTTGSDLTQPRSDLITTNSIPPLNALNLDTGYRCEVEESRGGGIS